MASTSTPLYKYQLRLLRFLFPIRIGSEHQAHIPFEKIGSNYGFVAVPKGFLQPTATVYSVGAGEDVSSDVEMVRQFGCVVHILDPTPKAIQHFERLQRSAQNGEKMHTETGEEYHVTPQIMEKLVYHAFALWDKEEKLRFFEPVNPDHVSHSITNIQSSGTFIEVQARTLDSLMAEWQHKKIDYLKLDIEGAEYQVVDYLTQHKTPVDVLYLEYHYNKNIAPLTDINMIKSSLARLFAMGYRVFYQADRRYFGLIHSSALAAFR